MSEHAEFRAAGQAIAALLHGVQIVDLSRSGIVLGWRDDPDGPRPRGDVLADIAIGLAGIAAEQGYRFGPHPAMCEVSWSFTSGQIEDWALARELIGLIDPTGAADVLYEAWNQMQNLITAPAVWRAVEAIAVALRERGRLEGADVAQIAAKAWERLPLACG